jgi:hypothetical protein
MEGLLNLASQQRKAGIMASELTTVANQGGSGQNQTQGGIGGCECPPPFPLTTVDLASLVAGANAHHGNGDDISGLIQGAMGGLQNVQADPATVNEERVVANHAEAYAQGNAGSLGASAMGSAAALQAFKAFAGAGGSAGGAGGGGVQALIGMAMSEAVKVGSRRGLISDSDCSSLTSRAALRMAPSRMWSTRLARLS